MFFWFVLKGNFKKGETSENLMFSPITDHLLLLSMYGQNRCWCPSESVKPPFGVCAESILLCAILGGPSAACSLV